MKKILFSLALLLGFMTSAIANPNDTKLNQEHMVGNVYQPGGTFHAIAYCKTEAEAKKLADAAKLEGNKGYGDYMMDRHTKCIDGRYWPQALPYALKFNLKEALFQSRHADGRMFQFWSASPDGYDHITVYIWNLLPEDNEHNAKPLEVTPESEDAPASESF